MVSLRDLGLDEVLRERIAAGTPVLGICLGLQLAFERSTEQGGAEGLGIVAGVVRPLLEDARESGSEQGESAGGSEAQPGTRLKLPHIGWNEASLRRPSPLWEGLPERCAFYHVHSFAPVPSNEEDVVATAVYGAPFVTAVEHGSFYGVQFHPEKSSAAGLRLLANFARICSLARARVAT
jgi:glutamine amidotransferase